jgi:hypothetical protein
MDPSAKDGSKTTLILGAIAIIGIVVIGAIYFMAVKYSEQVNNIPQITPIPRAAISPTPPVAEATEADIDTLDLGDPEEELKSIEQELNQL